MKTGTSHEKAPLPLVLPALGDECYVLELSSDPVPPLELLIKLANLGGLALRCMAISLPPRLTSTATFTTSTPLTQITGICIMMIRVYDMDARYARYRNKMVVIGKERIRGGGSFICVWRRILNLTVGVADIDWRWCFIYRLQTYHNNVHVNIIVIAISVSHLLGVCSANHVIVCYPCLLRRSS
ncbi:hypothetical protein JOM56_006760 [Amanita muscaria]